jgi:hypothetical protein
MSFQLSGVYPVLIFPAPLAAQCYVAWQLGAYLDHGAWLFDANCHSLEVSPVGLEGLSTFKDSLLTFQSTSTSS